VSGAIKRDAASASMILTCMPHSSASLSRLIRPDRFDLIDSTWPLWPLRTYRKLAATGWRMLEPAAFVKHA
jgi:hypothetical protein